MRLICPHCQLPVTVPDTTAGIPTSCPACNQSITPPALTGAAIDAAPEPAAPPSPPPASSRVPPPPVAAPAQTPGPDATRLASAGRPWLRLTLRRDFAHWLAPAALIVAFLFTFFTWVAVAPNGTRVYTQNAWQVSWGTVTTDVAGEQVMKAEAELKDHLHASFLLILYWVLLIPTAAIAISDRILARNPSAVPDVFRAIWPHRQAIIAGLCVVLLLLLVLPVLTGVGLQSAAIAAAAPAPLAPDKPEPTTAEKAKRDLDHDIKIAGYGIERTMWLKLAILVQIVAVAGVGLSWWLDRHPNAPDPRIEVYC